MKTTIRLTMIACCMLWTGSSWAGDRNGQDPSAKPGGQEVLCSKPLTQLESEAPIPHHREPYVLHTGAQENVQAADRVAFSQVVQFPGVPWLRLHFGAYKLGEKSYLTITSLEDGDQQRFDAEGLTRWSGASAFFNGDSVEVELHVAPGESGVFFSLTEVTVGEWVGVSASAPAEAPPVAPLMVCGTDNRVSSTDAAVGRVVPIGCTAWIGANGAFLSAGHCAPFASNSVVEFNVPASWDDGTIRHPDVENQYPIDLTSVTFSAGGVGDDWAVFRTLANANGDFAIERQGAFYRMSRDLYAPTFRITGYGVDGPPPCYGESRQPYCPTSNPPRNADSQTQQTHVALSHGETVDGPSDAYWEHEVDITGGNSGSPLIFTSTTFSVGIATHGTPYTCGSGNWNIGTSFENDDLEDAVASFPGSSVVYVDQGHGSIENGTVFRPYDTVLEGAILAPSGAILSIVTGSYNETLTLNKPMRLTAPVGAVTIGN